MFTRRDSIVALAAASLTAGVFALANTTPPTGSWVKQWDDVPAKPTESGSVRTFYNGATGTLKNLDVHVTTLNPGAAPHPPHKHPNEEMLVMKQGTVEALINGQWVRVGPGGIIYLASNIFHGVRNVGSDQAVYTVIGFKTESTPEGQTVISK